MFSVSDTELYNNLVVYKLHLYLWCGGKTPPHHKLIYQRLPLVDLEAFTG